MRERSWFDDQDYRLRLAELKGGSDAAARETFRQIAFSDSGPYSRGLVATGRFCDLCQAVGALMRLRANVDYAESVVGRVQEEVLRNQRQFAEQADKLVSYIEANQGVVEGLLGEYHLIYTVSSLGLSFWFPWPVLAVTAVEALINNYNNMKTTVPEITRALGNLKTIATRLDEKRVDIVYWRSYASSLASKQDRLLDRSRRCAEKQCFSDRDTKQLLAAAALPACAAPSPLAGCWAFASPAGGSLLIEPSGPAWQAHYHVSAEAMWSHYGGTAQPLISQSGGGGSTIVMRGEWNEEASQLTLMHRFTPASLESRFPALEPDAIGALMSLDPYDRRVLNYREGPSDYVFTMSGDDLHLLEGNVFGFSLNVNGIEARGSVGLGNGRYATRRAPDTPMTWDHRLVKVEDVSPFLTPPVVVSDTDDDGFQDYVRPGELIAFESEAPLRCTQRVESASFSLYDEDGKRVQSVVLTETRADSGKFRSGSFALRPPESGWSNTFYYELRDGRGEVVGGLSIVRDTAR